MFFPGDSKRGRRSKRSGPRALDVRCPGYARWPVATYVPADSLAATIRDQIGWLKAHNIDIVLVGLQFAPQMLRDQHYVTIRDLVRRIGAQENVIVIRFSEAMEIINKALAVGTLPVAEQFAEDQGGYDCLAQYVARAITLGAFGTRISAPPNR